MSNITHIVTNIVLQKLRQKAKKLKRDQSIPHYQALEIVSKEAGFNSWHHLIKSAQITNFSELALYEGLVIAMDIKDAQDFFDEEQLFVEDLQIQHLVYDDLVDSYKNSLDDGNNRKGDFMTDEEVENIVTLHLQNYIFFRFTGPKLPSSIEDVVKITSKITFWPPEFVWLKGQYFDTYSLSAIDSEGNITGVRF